MVLVESVNYDSILYTSITGITNFISTDAINILDGLERKQHRVKKKSPNAIVLTNNLSRCKLIWSKSWSSANPNRWPTSSKFRICFTNCAEQMWASHLNSILIDWHNTSFFRSSKKSVLYSSRNRLTCQNSEHFTRISIFFFFCGLHCFDGIEIGRQCRCTQFCSQNIAIYRRIDKFYYANQIIKCLCSEWWVILKMILYLGKQTLCNEVLPIFVVVWVRVSLDKRITSVGIRKCPQDFLVPFYPFNLVLKKSNAWNVLHSMWIVCMWIELLHQMSRINFVMLCVHFPYAFFMCPFYRHLCECVCVIIIMMWMGF